MKRRYEAELKALGLPPNLITLLEAGKLRDAISRAYQKLESMNERLDEFERDFPDQAARMPWAEARQQWKNAGRPMPEWHEVLQWIPPNLRPSFQNIRLCEYWKTPEGRKKINETRMKYHYRTVKPRLASKGR